MLNHLLNNTIDATPATIKPVDTFTTEFSIISSHFFAIRNSEGIDSVFEVVDAESDIGMNSNE
jgi:aspartyl/asparaginyl beta-hydroxylase (cupin superfamily)